MNLTMQPAQIQHYHNAIEPLVVQEVERQMQQLPARLVQYLNPAQVIAYALNRLPPMYATSLEGWHRQQQRAKEKMDHQIFMAVRQGLAAVQRDPLKISTPLMFSVTLELLDGKQDNQQESQKYHCPDNYHATNS
jgi:hypothetical protein